VLSRALFARSDVHTCVCERVCISAHALGDIVVAVAVVVVVLVRASEQLFFSRREMLLIYDGCTRARRLRLCMLASGRVWKRRGGFIAPTFRIAVRSLSRNRVITTSRIIMRFARLNESTFFYTSLLFINLLQVLTRRMLIFFFSRSHDEIIFTRNAG